MVLAVGFGVFGMTDVCAWKATGGCDPTGVAQGTAAGGGERGKGGEEAGKGTVEGGEGRE